MMNWHSSYRNDHDNDEDSDYDHDKVPDDDHDERDKNDDDFSVFQWPKHLCCWPQEKLSICPKTAESRKNSRFVSDTMSFYAYKKIVPVSVSVSNVNKMC